MNVVVNAKEASRHWLRIVPKQADSLRFGVVQINRRPNRIHGAHMKLKLFSLAALALAGGVAFGASKPATLLNVSYDPTREFYVEYNAAFAKNWQGKTGQKVNIQ